MTMISSEAGREAKFRSQEVEGELFDKSIVVEKNSGHRREQPGHYDG